ncbi:hypothetical protein EW145_g2990 [Phellinidium pouzarii]|uniref:Uncharacterized protein n=1 Tax=Phellinidium pouzarii TaxID=167371 RepID=A0A4S4L9B4_9AGAM|nr:hypothetical protein EW145_g2990 [Phellinidium pouzarii]
MSAAASRQRGSATQATTRQKRSSKIPGAGSSRSIRNATMAASLADSQAPSGVGRGDDKDINKSRRGVHTIVSSPEARRLLRARNAKYFHESIWTPALQEDFAGAYQLAHASDEIAKEPSKVDNEEKREGKVQTQTRMQVQTQMRPEKERRRDSWSKLTGKARAIPRMASPAMVPPNTKVDEEEGEWGRSVRLALQKLENKFANEDPRTYLNVRRDSMETLAWRSAHRRMSDARLSALAAGSVPPSSPFEREFVAELLRENEHALRQPRAEPELPSLDVGPGLPYYYLTPSGRSRSYTDTINTNANTAKLETIFESKKAERRAGRQYKSFSTYTYLDESTIGSGWLRNLKRLWRRLLIFTRRYKSSSTALPQYTLDAS